MKRIIKILSLPLFLSVCLLYTTSCEQDNIVISDTLEEDNYVLTTFLSEIEVNDGKLYFPNQQTFEKVVEWLSENQEILLEFDKNFAGFTSALSAYNSLDYSELNLTDLNKETADLAFAVTDENGIYDVFPVVDSPILAALFNAEGMIQIENMIHKKFHNETVEFLTTDVVNVIESNYASEYIQNRRPIVRSFYLTPNNDDVVEMRIFQEECLQHYNRQGNAWANKVLGFSTHLVDGSYQEFRTTTKHRRRCAFGAWCKETGSNCYVSGSGQYTVNGQSESYSFVPTDNNNVGLGIEEVTVVIENCFCTIDDFSFTNSHEVLSVVDNSTIIGCDTSR